MKNGKLSKSRQAKLEASGINFQDTMNGDTEANPTNDLTEGIALLEAAGIDNQFTMETELEEQQEESISGKEIEPQRRSEVSVASEIKLHSE